VGRVATFAPIRRQGAQTLRALSLDRRATQTASRGPPNERAVGPYPYFRRITADERWVEAGVAFPARTDKESMGEGWFLGLRPRGAAMQPRGLVSATDPLRSLAARLMAGSFLRLRRVFAPPPAEVTESLAKSG